MSVNDIKNAAEFGRFVYSNGPGYDEPTVRAAFRNAVPLKTIAIYCYDPRAAEIPSVLAKVLPDEIYPGEVIYDAAGKKVGGTATIMPVVVAGGRAIDALRSITIGHHLFGVTNVAVVHHTNCGTSSFTAPGLIKTYLAEEGEDISTVYEKDSLAIANLAETLDHDVKLLRASAGIPKSVNIYGYVFNIDTDEFTLLISDLGTKQ
ncbi:Carbonic anhydrase [Acidisarcina polymorpha]|uniref:Carbonic anhydrase n=1 Tax=Acidisarcina polymorpha TaxID=2211140 RepID=A0A2Z5G9K9_9BACT|nr:carbonic anhydrase [Acidisarcina polymorpha]AXC15831.1 Carbonic anhydrase [Acidisarcina polymorpha]